MSIYTDDTPEGEAAKAKQRERILALADSVKWVMEDPRGRCFVWSLLEEAGIYRTSFTGEVQSTIFNEGQRNSGIKLMSRVIALCPENYALMVSEQQGK